MANHRGAAAALLLVASLVVAVALSGANGARPSVRPDKTAVLHGADVMRTGGNTTATVRRDANVTGHVGVAAAPAVVQPECDEKDNENNNKKKQHDYEEPFDPDHHEHDEQDPKDQEHEHDEQEPEDQHDHDDPVGPDSVEAAELGLELCSTCQEPKPEPKPGPVMTCNEVHAVGEGETCDSIVQCKGLGQDDFLRFNPNLCCDKLFVGQWVCLDACGADD